MRLVYLSPVPWASFAQRPHKFVEWFQQRSAGEVLWIDPYPTRLPVLADVVRARPNTGSTQGRHPSWLTVLRPRALPIEPLPGSGTLNRLLWRDLLVAVSAFAARGPCRIGAGKPSELALQILQSAPGQASFYDAMDEFPAFYSGLSRWAMERREWALSARVDRLMVSSTQLGSRFARHAGKVATVRNACAADTLPPVETLPAAPAKLVLGYVGTIGHWFDWPLVIELAKRNPTATVRLIGPVHVPPTAALPANIELLPPCPHPQAIDAMTRFSVGLIPFLRNDLTASVDPIKYYEYRALGLPVASTAFGEMALRREEPGVFLVDEASNLAQLVKEAAAHRSGADQIRAFRRANSWEARFDASGILP